MRKFDAAPAALVGCPTVDLERSQKVPNYNLIVVADRGEVFLVMAKRNAVNMALMSHVFPQLFALLGALLAPEFDDLIVTRSQDEVAGIFDSSNDTRVPELKRLIIGVRSVPLQCAVVASCCGYQLSILRVSEAKNCAAAIFDCSQKLEFGKIPDANNSVYGAGEKFFLVAGNGYAVDEV